MDGQLTIPATSELLQYPSQNDRMGELAVVNTLLHVLLVSVLGLAWYIGVNLIAYQHLDERNGVISGQLIPNTDHWLVARQIVAGEELTNFRYPPGFSVYIAAALYASEAWGGSYFFWRLVQDSISTVFTTILILMLMLCLTQSWWCVWGAAFVLMYNLAYSAGTASDLAMASFLPWFFASLLLMIQALQGLRYASMRALGAGVLLAIAGFIRPDVLCLVPFLALTLGVFYRAQDGSSSTLRSLGKTIGFALAGFSAVLIPWIFFASIRSGAFVLYSTGFAPSHIDGMMQFPGNPVSESFKSLPLHSSSTFEIAKLHLSLFQLYPMDWLTLWFQKLWQPWYLSGSQRWNWLFGIQTGLLIGPVMIGAWFWLRQKGTDLAFSLAAGVIIYFWLVTTAVLPLNRYMPPVYPFLGMFAGFAGQAVWRWRHRPRAQQPLPLAA